MNKCGLNVESRSQIMSRTTSVMLDIVSTTSKGITSLSPFLFAYGFIRKSRNSFQPEPLCLADTAQAILSCHRSHHIRHCRKRNAPSP